MCPSVGTFIDKIKWSKHDIDQSFSLSKQSLNRYICFLFFFSFFHSSVVFFPRFFLARSEISFDHSHWLIPTDTPFEKCTTSSLNKYSTGCDCYNHEYINIGSCNACVVKYFFIDRRIKNSLGIVGPFYLRLRGGRISSWNIELEYICLCEIEIFLCFAEK